MPTGAPSSAKPFRRRSGAPSNSSTCRPMSPAGAGTFSPGTRLRKKSLRSAGCAEADRNSLLSVLTNPATRRLFGASWADEARRIVAQFRATHDLWAGDPAFHDLLARLRRRLS